MKYHYTSTINIMVKIYVVTDNIIGCQGCGAIGAMVGGNVKWQTAGKNLLAAFFLSN